jgi:outer membrane protein assembly factor BamA
MFKFKGVEKYFCAVIFILLLCPCNLFSQHHADSAAVKSKDSLSKFDRFNQKAEHLFKILPVPIVTYSSEAGNTFGLAKFNLIKLSKTDTISNPSKVSGVFTMSTKGRINASLSTELVMKENKYIVLSYINYKKTPEYIFGIGNDVSVENLEEIETNRIKFVANGLVMVKQFLYVGLGIEITNYFDLKIDSNSVLYQQNVSGTAGGSSNGINFNVAYDTRKSRYNPTQGIYIFSNFGIHPSFIGSKYQFNKYFFDIRKYYTTWHKQVLAMQATTTWTDGDIPFYDLALMGGDSRMRGYYEGAIRDKVLIDAQVEYRVPVWNIFGVAAWVGTGRVAESYSKMNIDGFRISYGAGLRIRVDSKNNSNMRFDFGFGPHGIKGVYINFAEAF